MPTAEPPAHADAARRRTLRRLLSFASSVLGAMLVAALGWVVVRNSLSAGALTIAERPRAGWVGGAFGQWLARLSYDLSFTLRGPIAAPDACIVYLDEKAGRALQQRGGVWDRRLHAQLLRRLAADRPRAVLFDILFSEPAPESAADEDFAAALREHGRVFLGAALEASSGDPRDGIRVSEERVIAPIAPLRRAAAGWGLITFRPIDADYGVRKIYTGLETVPSVTWRMAKHLGAALPDTAEARAEPRWLNPYGRANAFPALSYDTVLDPDGVKPGTFRDRIVVVGGRSTVATLNLGKDDFRNPYGLLGGEFSSGVELHLTALLNLLRGEWLTRLEPRRELWSAIVAGLVLGALLPRFRPHVAALLAALAAAVVVLLAWWLFTRHRVWWAWGVPVFVQTPVALAWGIGTRYFIEERRRRALRSAFGHYVSPHIADRIADAEFDLRPGGSVVEATVLITDLEGFTPLAESLRDPGKVSEMLIQYFTQCTEHILASDGTIMNFVGDSVTAVWGAPLAVEDHIRRAARAALLLQATSRVVVDGREFRTRLGLHTGRVLAGNVGSAERFDYVIIGDTVNFTSRLEGLNKTLGTGILISDAVHAGLGAGFLTRRVGEFRVVGKTEAHGVHELLASAPGGNDAVWPATFASGLEAFRRRDLDAAELRMRATIAQRGADGPAEFYLRTIDTLRRDGLPTDWNGVIEISVK